MRRLIDNGNRPITPKPHIGHYGRLRKAYLEQYRHRLYTALVASEKLYPHLAETDRAARDMLDYLMPRLAREAGATEALKAADPMKWVGLMNNCKAKAEEINPKVISVHRADETAEQLPMAVGQSNIVTIDKAKMIRNLEQRQKEE